MKTPEIAIPKIVMQTALLAALCFICFCLFKTYTITRDMHYAIYDISDEIGDISDEVSAVRIFLLSHIGRAGCALPPACGCSETGKYEPSHGKALRQKNGMRASPVFRTVRPVTGEGI